MKTEKKPTEKKAEKKPVEKKPRKRAARKRLSGDVAKAVKAALDKKALDVVVLDLRNTPAFTDFFVLCSGLNQRQVKAIADAVEETLRAAKVRPAHIEGYDRAEWVLMDFFTFIVHVFTPQTQTVLFARAAVGGRRADRSQRRARAGRSGLVTRRIPCCVPSRERTQKPRTGRSSPQRLFRIPSSFRQVNTWQPSCDLRAL